MTRRRAFDWVLIVVLMGTWAALFARGISDGLRTERGFIALSVSSAASGGYPEVLRTYDEFLPGDRIVAVDGEDFRGRTALAFFDRATRIARERGSVHVVAERAGTRFDASVELSPRKLWWVYFPVGAVGVLVGVVLLVRAPGWHLARLNLVMLWAWGATHAAMDWLDGPRGTWFESVLSYVLLTVATTLSIWIAQEFTPSARPVPLGYRLFAPAVGLLLLGGRLVRWFLPFSEARLGAFVAGQNAFVVAGVISGVARAYRRSDPLERRQLRWVVLGYCVAFVGGLAATLLRFVTTLSTVRVTFALASAGLPIGILVAVVGYRWLDIDRVITAAASYTLVGIVVLGAALALVPRVATAAATALGVDPAVAQWLLTMALVLAAVPAYLYLRPRLDRQMFRERHRRISGLERLLDEVGRCSGAEDLWQLTSERLEALLAPESLVVYAREGEVFTARFTRGRAAPPYAADSLLVRALERRGRPLAADSAELDPFDRAALETLGVAVVVPIGTQGSLLGFASLGRKRSGDIYTREETAQLAAIASRCALVLRSPAPSPDLPPQIFRREGELWTISSRGKEIRVRDTRGMHYLALLLREPGREFHAIDLVRAAEGAAPQSATPEPELRVARRLGDAGPVLDAQARAAYRERLGELDLELAEAERRADLGRQERVSAEREALLGELESAARGRRAGSDLERARVAVTKAIKLALEKIAEGHPELAANLAATVRRGYVCAYEPQPGSTAAWEM